MVTGSHDGRTGCGVLNTTKCTDKLHCRKEVDLRSEVLPNRYRQNVVTRAKHGDTGKTSGSYLVVIDVSIEQTM